MAQPDGARRGVRVTLAWVLSAVLILLYNYLPSGGETELPSDAESTQSQDDLDIVAVSPTTAAPGEAVVVSFVGARDPKQIRVFAGKVELEVLSRRPSSVVARLPGGTRKRVKIRVFDGVERSKPFDILLQPPNFQKSFRSLAGGFALMIFGIALFARGAREAVGLGSARALARVARRGVTALALGVLLGALAQSTTAAAGVLTGLVTSNLLAVVPAATAFLGAALGAATAPIVAGVVDAREGLLAVALGVIWLSLKPNRRAAALGRLALGAGLLAFGLHLLRQGFEPFVSNPALLPLVDRLRADSPGGLLLCSLLGVALVATLQGPAPVFLLVLSFAETTGHWDLRTSLAVLSGTGLGAAVAALLTTRAARESRELAKLELTLGACTSALALGTLGVWPALADWLLTSTVAEMAWGKRVLMPNFAPHLAVAFGLSQLFTALLLVPAVPALSRLLARFTRRSPSAALPRAGNADGVVRAGLLDALKRMAASLPPIAELALGSQREAGQAAELRLSAARAALDALLAGPMQELSAAPASRRLGQALFASVQFRRALDALLFHAERIADDRIALASSNAQLPSGVDDERTLNEMHGVLMEGCAALLASLETREAPDLEAARAREIRMNALEARARSTLIALGRGTARLPQVQILDLIGAYEAAGNQLYRLIEAMAESDTSSALVEAG